MLVRIAIVVAGLALAGCTSAAESSFASDDDDGAFGDPAAPPDCQVDLDCVAAGATCCECPTFALPASSGWEDACADVDCPSPSGQSCPLTEAVCESGACVLRCEAVACDLSCPGGFAADAFGCLVCECHGGPPANEECAVDEDCVQVPADCCGCAMGGTDTAVPAGTAGEFEDSLGCDTTPACPGVDVCEPGLHPTCLGGTCRLVADDAGGGTDAPDAGVPNEPSDDPVRCGTDSLPPCPSGEACILNDPAAEDASSEGVGVCRPE